MRVLSFLVLGTLLIGGLTDTATFGQQPTTPLPPATPMQGVYTWTLAEPAAEAADLAQQYVKAEGEEKKKELRKKLGDLLSQQFDTQAEQQQKELADIEKQIASLRGVLKKRQEAKSTIVERRLEQLIEDAQGLGWQGPGNPLIHGQPGRHMTVAPVTIAPVTTMRRGGGRGGDR